MGLQRKLQLLLQKSIKISSFLNQKCKHRYMLYTRGDAITDSYCLKTNVSE